MEIRKIVSRSADDLTDNNWSSTVGLRSDFLPECPYDGFIELKFGVPVDLTVIQKHLKVRRNLRSGRFSFGIDMHFALAVEPCDPKPARGELGEQVCANVTIFRNIKENTMFELYLESGFAYSKHHGALKEDLVANFGGLRVFRIPFFEGMRDVIYSTKYFDLWLPHGRDEKTSLEIPISITDEDEMEKVAFRRKQVSPSILRLTADVRPGHKYSIDVDESSNTRDGYGQPLSASSFKFQTDEIEDVFQPMQPGRYLRRMAIFEKGQDWGSQFVIFTKGEEDAKTCNGMQIWPLQTVEDTATVGVHLDRWMYTERLNPVLGDPIERVHPSYNDPEGTVSSFDVAELIKRSGLLALQRCRKQEEEMFFLSMTETRLMVSVLTYISRAEGPLGIVFVTDMRTGKPAPHVHVTFFEDASRLGVRQISKKVKTDVDGMATAKLKQKFNLVAVVQDGRHKSFLISIAVHHVNLDVTQDSMIVDRKLIRPSETVYIKGYVRGTQGTKHAVPSDRSFTLVVTPSFDDEIGVIRYPIELSLDYGSYELPIEVPSNATLRRYNVHLRSNKEDDYFDSVHEYFLVGTPRQPTVELGVDAPKWVTPSGTATVTVTAESFIGASVGDEEISVDWSLSFEVGGKQRDFKGEETIVTDRRGVATFVLDLTEFKQRPPVGKEIEFKVQWVGPTGELIEETVNTKIAWDDLKIIPKRTVETDIPKQVFGVWVELSDLSDGPLPSDTPYKAADISLKRLEDGESYDAVSRRPLDAAAIESCRYSIHTSSDPCSFQLPTMGVFVLETCVNMDASHICRRTSVGRDKASWESRPLKSFLPIGVHSKKKDVYKPFDDFEIVFENPYHDTHVMITWGNSEKTESFTRQLPDNQRSSVHFSLGRTCKFGCSIGAVMSVPRQTRGLPTDLTIPIFKLQDPAAPHSEFWHDSVRLDATKEDEIKIDLELPDAAPNEGDLILPPGVTTSLEISLDTRKPTEVTVMIVDKAILQLVSNPPVDLAHAFEVDLKVSFAHTTYSEFIVSPGAIQALIDDFNAKKSLNPWFDISSELSPSSMMAEDVGLSGEDYIRRISEYLTVNPQGDVFKHERGVRRYAKSTTAKMAAEAYTVEEAPDIAGEVRSEEDFKANALFITKIATRGKLSIEFDTPVNLGAFEIRAYAASTDAVFGNAQAEFIVKRDISLTPSVPRFVRVGDVFDAGVVVTVTGSPKTKITLNVEAEGPLEVNGRHTHHVSVGADKQEQARFFFTAFALGDAFLTFTATDRHGNQDAVKVSFSIEGPQELVVVGTSFVISSSDPRHGESSEGLDLPNAVPGTDRITITAGVGQEAAVLSLAEQVISRNPAVKCPHNSGFVLSASLIPAIINPYTPWDYTGYDERIQQIIKAFEAAVAVISVGPESMTRSGVGLLSYLSCPDHPRHSKPRALLSINAEALWLLNEVKDEFNSKSFDIFRYSVAALSKAGEEWRAAVQRLCVEQAVESRSKTREPISVDQVARCRAALGASWEPRHKRDSHIKKDLSMRRLSRHFDELSLEMQALYIITLQRENRHHSDVNKAVDAWTSLYRVTGRTAYISAYEGSATPASNRANSLILMAMARAGEEGQLLPKLASYVSAPVSDNYGFKMFRPYDMSVAMWALAAYDDSRGSTDPDVTVTAKSGSDVLFEETFYEDTPPYIYSLPFFKTSGQAHGSLEFSAVGIGEVSVNVVMEFVPRDLLPFPSYRGIFVERSIQLEDEAAGGGALSVVPQGSVVFVKVQFMTPDSLQETIVRVLMPAGLEPVDPNIAGGRNYCPVPLFSLFRSFRVFSCPLQETHPNLVSFEYGSVSAGTHSVTFRAVAVTSGTFTLPPTRVFVRDQPEVSGLSSAGSFEVCSDDCEPEYAEAAVEPKSCPNDCSGNGSCNLQEGTCVCFRGFSGKHCESAAAAATSPTSTPYTYFIV